MQATNDTNKSNIPKTVKPKEIQIEKKANVKYNQKKKIPYTKGQDIFKEDKKRLNVRKPRRRFVLFNPRKYYIGNSSIINNK